MKEDLIVNSSGRIVSKRASLNAKARMDFGKVWRKCVRMACDELFGVDSTFQIPKKETPLYLRAIEFKSQIENK